MSKLCASLTINLRNFSMVSEMSETREIEVSETFAKIFQILKQDKLTPAEHLAILTKLIILILKLGEESGISQETLLQARIKIVTAILQGE